MSDPQVTAPIAPPRTGLPLVLLYDGTCGLCARSVQWILERDPGPRRGDVLRFAPLQGDTAAPVLARHGIAPHPERGFESLVLVHDLGGPRERVLTHSDAAIGIGRYLGARWAPMARLAGLLPRGLRDLGYSLVARNRFRMFGTVDACRIPKAGERKRFLP
jgi:predicted DCC family thiol-disulfide oxidoreductase YuxK